MIAGVGKDPEIVKALDRMIHRLDQSMGTKTHVPQGGVIWVFAV